MLFIGVGMVASVSERHDWLIRIHKPLGIAILILACCASPCACVIRRRRCPPICRRCRSWRHCLALAALHR
jgi:hypothetical protein